MKDLFGVIEYAFVIGVPGYAAKLLFASGHRAIGILVILHGIYSILYRLYGKEK
jgi:hypothetical protein